MFQTKMSLEFRSLQPREYLNKHIEAGYRLSFKDWSGTRSISISVEAGSLSFFLFKTAVIVV